MEWFAWVIMIQFTRSTVPFNSHVLALQLLLVYVAQTFECCQELLQLMEQELVCLSAVKLAVYKQLLDLADRMLMNILGQQCLGTS